MKSKDRDFAPSLDILLQYLAILISKKCFFFFFFAEAEMLHVYSDIKILIYYAISYDYLAQICFARKHDKIFSIWFFFEHSEYS